MDVFNLVEDKKLFSLMDKYSENMKIGENLKSIILNSKNAEIIIPVLGMQGMGKSTLINAFLSENILPNDADETTCVPVEVKYGIEEKAIIYFNDSNKTKEVNTREELNEYVDNMYNKANEKNVSHIVLYRNVQMLKNGITIVDLPGVGSLTKNNEKTTLRYVKNLCSAIFVIPTTPTIRRTEEIFIKGLWSQFSSVIFVQNSFGESKREIKESVEFNTKVLRKIADEIQVSFNDEIIVVNAYDAAKGKINNNNELIEKSNIKMLIDKTNEAVLNWSQNIEVNLYKKIKLSLSSCKMFIGKRIDEYKMSKKDLEEQLKKEEDAFLKNTKNIEKQIEKIEDSLDENEKVIKKFARSESENCVKNIRQSTFRVIDSGIVDGDKLSEAFKHYQEEYCSELINEYIKISNKIIIDLKEQIQEIGNIVENENSMSIDAMYFNNGESFKFEKAIPIATNLTGFYLGGIIIKDAVGGGLVAGPIGVVVGIAKGVATGLAFSIFGKGIKNKITNKRGESTKRELQKCLDDLEDQINENIVGNYKKIYDKVLKSCESYLENRKKEYKYIKEKNIEKLQKDYVPKYKIEELTEDLNYFAEKEKILNE
ncbi:MAG: dynamin family protein [Mollicutes bacterium]|nr:dynamin family protein [Mollicutes bacterium]